MDLSTRAILIGGTSNIGKSTVAERIAARLGWGALSTDRLARHPGRPWPMGPKTVPPHVVEHYLRLSPDELRAAQLAHYRRMWPIVEAFVRYHCDPAVDPIVLEGSGILPDKAAALHVPEASAIWLTGAPELIEARIRNESGYDTADAEGRRLIDQFVARSQGYDVAMMDAVRRLELPWIEVTPETGVDRLADACLERMRPLRRVS